MSLSGLLVQALNGLAAASTLFLLASGLSLIFGVTRIVNFAHGSLYMLGLYGAYSLIEFFGRTPLGFWGAVVLSALLVGLVGILIEVLVLRRGDREPPVPADEMLERIPDQPQYITTETGVGYRLREAE